MRSPDKNQREHISKKATSCLYQMLDHRALTRQEGIESNTSSLSCLVTLLFTYKAFRIRQGQFFSLTCGHEQRKLLQ